MSTNTCCTDCQTYRVSGMTCGHCVSAIEREVGAIPGVTDVTAHLTAGDVIVCSDRTLTDTEVAAAVDEAGYQLTS